MCVDEAKDTPLPHDVPWDTRMARGSGRGWWLMPDRVSWACNYCCPDSVHFYSCCKRVAAVSHYLNSHQNSHFHTKMCFIFLVVLKQTMSYLENWSLSCLNKQGIFSWGLLRQVRPHSPCVWGVLTEGNRTPAPPWKDRSSVAGLGELQLTPCRHCPESQLHSAQRLQPPKGKENVGKNNTIIKN